MGLVAHRYILNAGTVHLKVAGEQIDQEVWVGVEIEGRVDLEEFSRKGYDLIPSEGMTREELRSVGIDHFERVVLA